MMMLGMALLLPWNAHIKTISYLRLCLHDHPTLSTAFSNYITACFSVFNTLTVLLLNTLCSGWSWRVEKRVTLGLVLSLLWVAVVMVMIYGLGTTAWQWSNFTWWLVVVSGTAISSGLLQHGGYALAGRVGVDLAPWFLAGQAVAGLLVSVVSLLADAFDAEKERIVLVTIIYFSVAFTLLLVSLVVFSTACNSDCRGLTYHNDEVQMKQPRFNLSTLNTVKWYTIGIWLNFFVTLSVFPFTVAVFKTSMWLFVPISFIAFDLGDLIGKSLPGVIMVPRDTIVLVCPWIRVLFIPTMLYLVHSPHSPFLFILFMFMMALTSGLCNTWLLMSAPNQVKTERQKETIGAMIGLFLIIGISSGSIASFGWRRLIV